MKKADIHNASQKEKHTSRSPAANLLTAASVVLSMMYICAMALLMLPDTICCHERAILCAEDIFSSSFRVVVIAVMSAVITEIIDKRFPSE